MSTCLTKNIECFLHTCIVSAGPTVNIAAVSISVILIVFLFITGVGVLVVLSVIICRRKSLFDTIIEYLILVNVLCIHLGAHERKEYVYQVFNKKIGVNCWNFICVITPKEQSSVRITIASVLVD